MDLKRIVADYAENVTAFQFGKVKVSKHVSKIGPSGWIVIVQGPVGGHMLNFSDEFLYNTSNQDHDPFKDENCYTDDLNKALSWGDEIWMNLGTDQSVINPRAGFISRYLNPKSFERTKSYWESDEAQIEFKSR